MRIAILALSLVATGCDSNDGTPIHLVFPNGYRGPWRVVVGDETSSGYRREEGRHVYVFPESGVLHAPLAPFDQWHRLTAEYVDGSPIYWIEPGPPDATAIRTDDLGAAQGEVWGAVGNEMEVEKWRRIWTDRGPPGLEAEMAAPDERP